MEMDETKFGIFAMVNCQPIVLKFPGISLMPIPRMRRLSIFASVSAKKGSGLLEIASKSLITGNLKTIEWPKFLIEFPIVIKVYDKSS